MLTVYVRSLKSPYVNTIPEELKILHEKITKLHKNYKN